MSAHWGQRLGNIIAIVTLLTAAAAVISLWSRHEPARHASPIASP